jgi:hypothetical protein
LARGYGRKRRKERTLKGARRVEGISTRIRHRGRIVFSFRLPTELREEACSLVGPAVGTDRRRKEERKSEPGTTSEKLENLVEGFPPSFSRTLVNLRAIKGYKERNTKGLGKGSSVPPSVSVAFFATDDSDKTRPRFPSSITRYPDQIPSTEIQRRGHGPRAGAAGHHHVSSISGRDPKPETRLSVASKWEFVERPTTSDRV